MEKSLKSTRHLPYFRFHQRRSNSDSVIGRDLWEDKEERKLVVSTLLAGREVTGKEIEFRKKNGENYGFVFRQNH